jgi:RHS repeat-associated protein
MKYYSIYKSINRMKKHISLLLLAFFLAVNSFGQVLSNENFIYSSTPQKGIQEANYSTLTKADKIQSITYFDGLGRPMQSVAIGQGGNGEDIITPITYDSFGRQDKEYLPYTAVSNGTYRSTAVIDAATFYNTAKYENTLNPFSEKLFEASPLNRVLQQAAPGNDWALSKNHTIKIDYQTNTATEVKLFQVATLLVTTTGLYNPTLSQSTNYAVGQLYKTITKDENWIATDLNDKTTEEFKDKEGRVVLKRTYNNALPHDTYYVYDEYGNLTYVIPPLANGAFDAATLSNLCYQYKYDYRNRLVEKKLPGKDWEFIIYDKLDRVILTQDANLKADNKWLFTKYDAFSRPVYTGEYTDLLHTTRASMQAFAAANTSLFEKKQTTERTINGTKINYTNNAFPNLPDSDPNINLFTINYYDDYANVDLQGAGTAFGQTTVNSKGLPTVNKVRVLETTQWITNVSYYDDKARPIYSFSKNDYLGTTVTVQSNLDFVGKVLKTITNHIRTAPASMNITIIDDFTYDNSGRLLTQTQKINNQDEELIVFNKYDDLGQLFKKEVGGKTIQARLQTVDYTYNIRGWLKGINDVSNIGNDLFSFKISYNDGPTDPLKKLYNGNISQTFWKTTNAIDTSLRSYDYSYDALNRLTLAADNQNKFKEQLEYDTNGNITFLQRDGNTVPGTQNYGAIDNLTYAYTGNRLDKVTDATSNTEGFNNGTSGASNDYSYDDNGNMKTDLNKAITDIAYNHLNLPRQVTINGQNINYTYDATGVKQRKIAAGITTDYASGFQYEGPVLKFFPTPEGYVEYNNGTFTYIYQYKDHLGNVRLTYKNIGTTTPTLQIVEESNYYPFGLKQKVDGEQIYNSSYKYKYNGKELQDEMGLNLYDYGARNYDPALGRWMNIDPLAEKSRRFNPYAYALDNPVYFIDPDGMMASPPPDWFVNNKTGAVVHVEGQSKLTQATADKIGAGNAKNYDRLGSDNMFGNKNKGANEIRKLGSSVVENPEGFMKKQGLTKVKNELVEQRTSITKGPVSSEERNTESISLPIVIESQISYAEPKEIGKITPVSSETIGNSFEATITTEQYIQTIDANTNKGQKSSDNLGFIPALIKLAYDVLTTFKK